jgi:hypothetical protein
MTPGEAAAFDRAIEAIEEIEEIERPHAADGMLDLEAAAEVTWGRPTAEARPWQACPALRHGS